MTNAAQRGRTVIADKAVRKIAERAAGEMLPPAAAGSARGSATVRGRRTAVALRIALPYPAPLSDTARRVQQHVAGRTRDLTGLEISAARLTVTRLTTTPDRPHPAAPADAQRDAHSPPRRRWSQRRLPMAILTLLAAAACAAVTADAISVHAAHHRAAAWRTHAVEWLADHGPGDAPVIITGVAVMLLGMWLIGLALTPGHRHQMSLTAPVRAGDAAVDRSTVATLVRDAVADVPGMGPVTVRARRRRLRVRARLVFGDQSRAREQATAAARKTLGACRLSRLPRLKVTVSPEPTWQPPAPDDTDTAQPPHTDAPGFLAAGSER